MAGNSKSRPGGRENHYTVFKLRLHPTPEQAELMEKTFACCRYLWNRMLTDAREFYAATDLQYIPTPACYKKEAPFLKEVDSQALCTVHQNLRKAFLDFFRAPETFGYPRFKTKKAGRDSFTVYCRDYRTGPSIRLTGGGLRMPKLGLVEAVMHRRPMPGWSLVSVTVSKSKTGKYDASVTFKYAARQAEPVQPVPERTVGLQYVPSVFYVDSEGGSPDLPDLRKSREKLARMQRQLARMERGSNRYHRQLQKIRRLHEHIANQRKDFIHKESRRIANAWDAVCVTSGPLKEDHSGFGMFRECLRYKLERQGKRYAAVDGASGAEDIKEKGFAQLCA